MLLSIIIPVYNGESFLGGCLESILSQLDDSSQCEIIVVDDGSIDKTGQVASNYQGIPYFYYYKKENGGVSTARNYGLSKAKGKYVTFVDADDSISTTLPKVIKLAEDCNDEILILRSFYKESNKEYYKWQGRFVENRSYTFDDLLKLKYKHGGACGVLYKFDFLISNNIRFPEGIENGEDTIFFVKCIMNSSRTSFHDIPFYIIVERENSASREFTLERLIRRKKNLNYLKEYIQKKHTSLSDTQLKIFKWLYYISITGVIKTSIKTRGSSFKFLISEFKIKDYLPVPTFGTLTDKCKVFLLNNGFELFYFFYLMKEKSSFIFTSVFRN